MRAYADSLHNGQEQFMNKRNETGKALVMSECLSHSTFSSTDEFDKMYYESERVYNKDYSTGEYCHEQSFKWGFQEGFDFAMKLIKVE